MVCPSSHYTNNMASLSLSHFVRNLIASRWVKSNTSSQRMGKASQWKNGYITPPKMNVWNVELWQAASRFISRNSHLQHIPRCAQEAPADLPRSSKGQEDAQPLLQEDADCTNYSKQSCSVLPHDITHSCSIVSACPSAQAGMLGTSDGRLWALWPVGSPWRRQRSKFEANADTSTQEWELSNRDLGRGITDTPLQLRNLLWEIHTHNRSWKDTKISYCFHRAWGKYIRL